MNTAIVVAAGSGKRFNSTIPKQFLEILGKPLLIYTLERFERCDSVSEVILVLSSAEIANFTNIAGKFDIRKITKIVSGGMTRAESVFNGFRAVNPGVEIIAVHDGARPLVSVDEISRTMEKARETGAACLVADVTDTIKTIDGDRFAGTLDRRKLKRALTPQAFRYEILQKAFALGYLGDDVTDECFLVEKLGYKIAFVEGNPKNIKITRPEDLVFAEAVLKDELYVSKK
ncbi:MAG: 2-C-methyl-D-erythritol 4-phosphate cytidylyltransferase [Pyrinomonadaceae bacterium]|jgi:2-C-methyl-D-erythritol 4-phosphate cytidylyltransferase|nr:2-C-methyl-D-erythritol 4-phosphate cytidylyltransferase [Blastocatellia bacterium]MDQ3220554.1 2-C-methyl-D-erythritol 4-phosphate cytidylyltransferase [Acidobacteriota bacterium]MDQ3490291.1 2-C-methyl-D-erythritol 4-phosphate cytidylyltransferase [Acidobacteriota bacterium]